MLGGFFSRRPGDLKSAPNGAQEQPRRLRVAIFPLQTVLFPGGTLGLKIFEQRYLDMAAACLKDDLPFGVCLLAEGAELGQTAVPHRVGTLATITKWDMTQLGVLNVTVRGGERFRIHDYAAGADKLLTGEVELLPGDTMALPDEFSPLLFLLQQILAERAASAQPAAEGQDYDSAEWVGHRLCEVLPVQWLAKQKLLELNDARSRLEILRTFLKQRGLLA